MRDRIRELLNDRRSGESRNPAGCPGRSDCNRLDAVELCKGCEFEKDSWGRWPDSLDWAHVSGEAKAKYASTQHSALSTQHSKDREDESRVQAEKWIAHLFWLYHKKEAGCNFHLDDLTPREWEGLEIVCEEVNRINPRL